MRILYRFKDETGITKTLSEIDEIGLNDDNYIYLIGSNSVSDVIATSTIPVNHYEDILRSLLTYGYVDLTTYDLDLEFIYDTTENYENDEYDEDTENEEY